MSENQKFITILKNRILMRQAGASERSRAGAAQPGWNVWRTGHEASGESPPAKPDDGEPNRAGSPFDAGLILIKISATGPLSRQPSGQDRASG
ncbi:MAG TPA: hypothetical protein VMM15_19870 [Bradyrhizobium sp.]|nr:hypothetical protein [Bradyrhizobium sp.]